jgi:hypothetical protein
MTIQAYNEISDDVLAIAKSLASIRYLKSLLVSNMGCYYRLLLAINTDY